MDAPSPDPRLRRLLADAAAASPYPGLRPFRPDEQRFFKGRRAQIEQITARLTSEKCVVVHGGSGSGKSSLVQAGVIPALRLQSIPDRGDFWRAAICTPGQAPVGNLVAALDGLLMPEAEEGRAERIRAVLASDGLGGFLPAFRHEIPVEAGVSRAVLDKVNLLVLIDQFEELFREENHDHPEAAWLAGLVVDAWRDRARHEGLYIILTTRSEDLHRCAEFIDLPNVINAAGYLTRRLEERELREAIVAPVRPLLIRARLLDGKSSSAEADVRPFDVKVVTRLLDAVEEIAADPDHLPLLQHLLATLWRTALRRWCSRGVAGEARIELDDLAHAIGLASWDEADSARRAWEARQVGRGGDKLAGRGWLLRRGLEDVAERLFCDLSLKEQRIARAAFCLMGEVDDRGVVKRRWTSLGKIVRATGSQGQWRRAARVLVRFMRPDPFIRAGRRTGQAAGRDLDVSHESLMRNWERLGGWLRRDRKDGAILLKVQQAYLARSERLAGAFLAARSPWWLGWLRPLRDTQFAEARKLPDRGYTDAWAERYQRRASPPLEALTAFVRGSRARQRQNPYLGVAGSLAAIALVSSILHSSTSGRFTELEARAFNAYALAVANDEGSLAAAPSQRQLHALFELDLAHRALETMREPWLAAVAYPGRETDRHRSAVPKRLAKQLVDANTRKVLASGLWPVAREVPRRPGEPAPAACGGLGDTITDELGGRYELASRPVRLPAIGPRDAVAALVRSRSRGEAFVALFAAGGDRCALRRLFALDVARHATGGLGEQLEAMARPPELRATSDLSLVIERDPPALPAAGDRVLRLDWTVACEHPASAEPCGGPAWVVSVAEVGWFPGQRFEATDLPDFDVAAVDATGSRRLLALMPVDRPVMLTAGRAPARDLAFNAGVGLSVRRDGSLLAVHRGAECVIAPSQPGFLLTGWSAARVAAGRTLVAYVVSASSPNGDEPYALYNHWLRVVELDDALSCDAATAPLTTHPMVKLDRFEAPDVTGLAFGEAGTTLEGFLVIDHQRAGVRTELPWDPDLLRRKLRTTLAAVCGSGVAADEKTFSSPTYRLLKGPSGSVVRELEGAGAACAASPAEDPRPTGSAVAVGLATTRGAGDSGIKP